MSTTRCFSCARTKGLTPTGSLRPALVTELGAAAGKPVPAGSLVCARCLNRARVASVLARLEEERGDLSTVEADIARRAAEHSSAVEHLADELETHLGTGQRLADRVAKIGGSWPFVIGFFIVLVVWMAVNTAVLATRAFDPYPFILLNLVLSSLAAIQAPIIMMAQNRVSEHDRLRADNDYRVNLKAELEIAMLHEKLDHLLHFQWETMMEIQRTQLELLAQLEEHSPGSKRP